MPWPLGAAFLESTSNSVDPDNSRVTSYGTRAYSRKMQHWRDLKQLPPENWVLALACFVNRLGTMVLPFFTLYLTRERGFSLKSAGALLASYALVGFFMGPAAGLLSDRFGSWPVMLSSLFGFAVMTLLYPFAQSTWVVVATTVLLAFTSEAFRPVASAAVVEHCEPHQRRAAYALNRFAINLGMSVGPAVGGFLVTHSFLLLFIVDGLTSFAAAIILGVYLIRDSHQKETPKRERPPFSLRDSLIPLADPRLKYFLLALFPLWLIFFQNDATMGIYVTEYIGMPASTFGLLYTINTLLIILFEIQLNLWTSAWSPRTIFILGGGCFAAGYGMMAIVTSFSGFVVSVSIWTVGEMLLFPTAAAYVADIAPEKKKGTYLGIFHSSFSLAWVLGPLGGTLLLSAGGGKLLWGGCFLLGILSMILVSRAKNLSHNDSPGAAHG